MSQMSLDLRAQWHVVHEGDQCLVWICDDLGRHVAQELTEQHAQHIVELHQASLEQTP
jgi:hypothetical protein